MYPNKAALDIPNVKETAETTEIIGDNVELSLKKGDKPNVLRSKLQKDGHVLWERQYSDHTAYKGVQLPKKVVEKIYSKNGKVFMTISYDIQYDEKPGLDKRLEQEIEIPKDAKSGPIARQF